MAVLLKKRKRNTMPVSSCKNWRTHEIRYFLINKNCLISQGALANCTMCHLLILHSIKICLFCYSCQNMAKKPLRSLQSLTQPTSRRTPAVNSRRLEYSLSLRMRRENCPILFLKWAKFMAVPKSALKVRGGS